MRFGDQYMRAPGPRYPGGRVAGFFLWLGGASPEVLAEAPHERNKFTGLGGIVLFTATMAAGSFIFALRMAVGAPLWLAIPLGLGWGFGIMNLDRWLVTAASRQDRWYKNLGLALPRLGLALLIGAVVSTPLVLQIFASEIKSELGVIHVEKENAFRQEQAASAASGQRAALQKEMATDLTFINDPAAAIPDPPELAKLKTDEAANTAQADFYEKKAACEIHQDSGEQCSGIPGTGARYNADKQLSQQYRDAAARNRVAIKPLQDAVDAARTKAKNEHQASYDKEARDLQDIDNHQQQQIAQHEQDVANENGLLARLDALNRLTAKGGSLRIAYITLLLFITAIEILPVFMKFLLSLGSKSAYDQVQEELDKASVSSTAGNFGDREEERRAEREEFRRQREAAMRKQVAKVVDAETEALDVELEAWRRRIGLRPSGTNGAYRPAPTRDAPRTSRLPGFMMPRRGDDPPKVKPRDMPKYPPRRPPRPAPPPPDLDSREVSTEDTGW